MTSNTTMAQIGPRPAAPHVNTDQGFTLQGIAVLVGLVVAVLTILAHGRRVRRENEADARSRTDELKAEIRVHNNSVEKRLTAAEAKITDFMPRAEIEGKIEHEKVNRQQADQQLKDRSERHDRDIVDIKVSVGRLDQKQDGLASDMGELKGLLKDFSRDVNAKLDKQQECLNSISRRAA